MKLFYAVGDLPDMLASWEKEQNEETKQEGDEGTRNAYTDNATTSRVVCTAHLSLVCRKTSTGHSRTKGPSLNPHSFTLIRKRKSTKSWNVLEDASAVRTA